MKKVKNFVMGCLGIMLLFPSLVQAEDLVIANGKKVKLDYVLTVDDQMIESTQGGEPLEYTHGTGQIIKGMASELEGMKVGQEKSIIVKPEDGYGQVIAEAIKEIDSSYFPEDFEAQVGTVISLKGEEGVVIPGIIMEVNEKTVIVNFNHPLAGKTLNFDVKIVDIE